MLGEKKRHFKLGHLHNLRIWKKRNGLKISCKLRALMVFSHAQTATSKHAHAHMTRRRYTRAAGGCGGVAVTPAGSRLFTFIGRSSSSCCDLCSTYLYTPVSLTSGCARSVPRCPESLRGTCACPGCRCLVSEGKSSDTVGAKTAACRAGTDRR